MKILCSIHLYPPTHNCGAEYMMHNVNKYLAKQGHEVRVLLWQANHHKIENVYVHEGIDVFPPDPAIVEKLFYWSDMVFTHLDYTQNTIHLAKMFKRPLVHFIHNYTPYESIIQAEKPQWIVYNSQAAKDALNYSHESMVMPPSVDWRVYDINRETIGNEYVTLINIDENKGGFILREIAKRMPDKKFLAVKGSYSEPANIGQITDQPSNVTIVPNTPFIRTVYERTRLLIMPSKFESWGMVGTEAMCSGIPVIANPTPGLKENLGGAGIFVDRDNIDAWVKAIKKLDNEKHYREASKKAKARSRELDPEKKLAEFDEWIREIKNK